jgi:hypothetical protein
MSTEEQPVITTVLLTCHNDGCGHVQEMDKTEAYLMKNHLFCAECGSSKVTFAPNNAHRQWVRNELAKFYDVE